MSFIATFNCLRKTNFFAATPKSAQRHMHIAKKSTGPEIMDPVFAKTSQNARFLLSENERFGLVFVKTGSINLGTGRYERRLAGDAQRHDEDPQRSAKGIKYSKRSSAHLRMHGKPILANCSLNW